VSPGALDAVAAPPPCAPDGVSARGIVTEALERIARRDRARD
jgi:hypothetical protein